MVVIARLVLEKGMYSTKVLAVVTPLACTRIVIVGQRLQVGTTKAALLSPEPPSPRSGYRVRCEGREWSRGSEVRLETQGAVPALPRSYPAWIKCIKNICGSSQPPLHKQIVPGDWLERLISWYFHRHANRNNTGLSFIYFPSLHLHVKTHSTIPSQWSLCIFWLFFNSLHI